METFSFSICAFSLILVGIFGVLTRKDIIRILLALNILETGINMLVAAVGYFKGSSAPILTSNITRDGFLPFVDPLPQALVLASIVIGAGTTAMALAITLKHYRTHKTEGKA